MLSLNYVDAPNSNLICCICRMPFTEPVTTRGCSHTFCKECIVRALGHSLQCPVDRSPLGIHDLGPANPIVQALVDELLVECVHREEGCEHTPQRHLLATHLQNECSYSRVKCLDGQCHERNDVGTQTHGKTDDSDGDIIEDDEPRADVPCSFCSTDVPRSDLETHNLSCPDYVVTCTHATNGCPWTGARASLDAHISTCAYEAVKGFFAVNSARLCALTEDNLVLRGKVDTLEGMVRNMKREMQTMRMVLGPWYRPERPFSTIASSDLPPAMQPSMASTSGEVLGTTVESFPTDVLAAYFPSPDEGLRPIRTDTFGRTAVAPVNLSTTLEGSFNGLRESVVTLAASVDSLGRRNEIALTNEAMRLNEEVMSLRAVVHGLRMQASLCSRVGIANLTGNTGAYYYDGSECADHGEDERGSGGTCGGAVYNEAVGYMYSRLECSVGPGAIEVIQQTLHLFYRVFSEPAGLLPVGVCVDGVEAEERLEEELAETSVLLGEGGGRWGSGEGVQEGVDVEDKVAADGGELCVDGGHQGVL